MWSISSKFPKAIHMLQTLLWEMFGKDKRETGSGEENEWVKEKGWSWENYFIASGEVTFMCSSFQLYLLTEWAQRKIPPPLCSGFAPRYEGFSGFLLHCAGRFPAVRSQKPFNVMDASKIYKQTWNVKPERQRVRKREFLAWFSLGQTSPCCEKWTFGSLRHFLRRALLRFTGCDGFSRFSNSVQTWASLKCFPVYTQQCWASR